MHNFEYAHDISYKDPYKKVESKYLRTSCFMLRHETTDEISSIRNGRKQGLLTSNTFHLSYITNLIDKTLIFWEI